MGPCPQGGDAFVEGGGQYTTLIEMRHPRRFSVDPKHMVWLVIAGWMLQNPFLGSQRRRLAQARCQIISSPPVVDPVLSNPSGWNAALGDLLQTAAEHQSDRRIAL